MLERELRACQIPEARSERMDFAEQQFGAAAELAAEHRRLYHEPGRRGPYLRVPVEWTLLDVVRAAVQDQRSA